MTLPAGVSDRILQGLAQVHALHPELSGDDLMGATGQALDTLLGPLQSVFHRAGPVIEGGQLCTRCGTVLQDLYGKHVAVAGDGDPWELRHDRGWQEGALVWELWRWGAPTAFPHAIGLVPEDQTEPNEEEAERWCQSPT